MGKALELAQLVDQLAGVVLPYAGNVAPSGFLLCYGQAVSRTTYARLFAVIGTTYGQGDANTTFNVPDMRGRTPYGRENLPDAAFGGGTISINSAATRLSTANGILTSMTDTANISVGDSCWGVGISAGAKVISIDSASQVTLSLNNLATGSGDVRFGRINSFELGAKGGSFYEKMTVNRLAPHAHASPNNATRNTVSGGSDNVAMGSSGTGYNTGTTGKGEAFPIMPPAIIMNWIIRT